MNEHTQGCTPTLVLALIIIVTWTAIIWGLIFISNQF